MKIPVSHLVPRVGRVRREVSIELGRGAALAHRFRLWKAWPQQHHEQRTIGAVQLTLNRQAIRLPRSTSRVCADQRDASMTPSAASLERRVPVQRGVERTRGRLPSSSTIAGLPVEIRAECGERRAGEIRQTLRFTRAPRANSSAVRRSTSVCRLSTAPVTVASLRFELAASTSVACSVICLALPTMSPTSSCPAPIFVATPRDASSGTSARSSPPALCHAASTVRGSTERTPLLADNLADNKSSIPSRK